MPGPGQGRTQRMIRKAVFIQPRLGRVTAAYRQGEGSVASGPCYAQPTAPLEPSRDTPGETANVFERVERRLSL